MNDKVVVVQSDLGMKNNSKEVMLRPRNIALAGREPLTPDLYASSTAKIYACGTCSMTFKTRADLYTHNKIVHNHRLFSCEFCDKLFTRSSSLRTHLRVHTGERPYQCSECGKCFTQLSNVLQHNRDVHIRDKRFKCVLCGRGFSRLETLQCHIRVHTGERIYKCSICDRTFSQRANLKVHMRIHRGEKARPLKKLSFVQPLWKPSPDVTNLSNSVTNITNQLVITAVSGSGPQESTQYSGAQVKSPGGYPAMPPLSLHSPTVQSPAPHSPTKLPSISLSTYIETVSAHARKDYGMDYASFLCAAGINLLFSVTVTSVIYDRLESRVKEHLNKLLRDYNNIQEQVPPFSEIV